MLRTEERAFYHRRMETATFLFYVFSCYSSCALCYKQFQFLLPEKGLEKVKTYANAGEDEPHAEPDFSGDGQFSFRLQVVAKSDTKEDDC